MYDVIVVGAGIAGAASAYFLSQQGLKVLVLEQKPLPRYKPCAGGVPRAVLHLFPFSFEPVIEREICGVTYLLREEEKVRILLPHRPIVMVMRDKFDHFVLKEAKAEVWEGIRVIGVQEDEEGVEVQLDDGRELRARYLIGADGANSTVARSLGLRRNKILGVALEAEVPAEESLMSRFDSDAFFIFGAVRWGYLWVFPKRAHLSVGIGAFGKTREDLRAILTEEMERLGISLRGIPLKAHPLPVYAGRERLHTRRTVLVGDAAGLMDPLLGEGIRYAVKSARLAARSILEGDVSRYSGRVHRGLGRHLSAARIWAWAFYRFPRASFEMGVRNPYLTPDFGRMFEDRLTYGRMMLRIPLYVWGFFHRLPNTTGLESAGGISLQA